MQLLKIQDRIHEVRGLKVMLDHDLADLYEVDTKALNQAVKRNIKRFPDKFMFRLNSQEWVAMRSQFVTAPGQYKRNVSALPYAFTEHGVTMLASVLRSDKAIEVNIAIVEAFIAMRSYTLSYLEMAQKLNTLEEKYNKKFEDVYKALKYLIEKNKITEDQRNRKRIGY